ncbi:MAG: SDR family NAD(P)-dependent oxidoreductase, partial [Rhodospirillaceae bacterium]|nr:SDR family NAD(P)-dependent oxidoreductase [Rhodospirillaceae bacterium]
LSCFDAVRALTAAPDEEGRVARARVDFEAVNRHAVARFHDLLRERGLFRDPGMRHEIRDIAAALKVVPRHRRFLDAALAHLAAEGRIAPQGEGVWQAVGGGSDAATAGARSADVGAMGAEAALLDRCFDALPDVLAGEVAATEVLFPDGSPESIQSVYRGNPASDWFNAQAASAVAARAQAALDAGEETLRIVEIGAGSGGTTEAVLAVLTPFTGRLRLDYAFTDLSPGFVKAAARRFGDGRPWFSTRPLDIEKDPISQGFAPGTADLVLAANVLHATRRMARSLGHAARLLRPRGWLVVNEAVAAEPFTTFTFGLLDGWWLAEDDQRLPHAPLLSADGWLGALADAGFGQARVLPGPASEPAVDGMRVIVAESAGLALVENVKREAAQTPVVRPAAAAPEARPTNPRIEDDRDRIAALERRVIAEVATAVELPDAAFDATLPFASLGIDSILAVAVVRHLNDRLGVTLRATDLFNYPDARRLTAHLAEAFPRCLGDPPESRPAEPMAVPNADADLPAPRAIARSNESRRGPARDAFAPIAVIGMSARFPDADDLDAFLRNLESGHDAVREIPVSRWPLDGFYDPDPAAPERSTGKWGGFLSRIDTFDPAYFRMSPREAELTDPQHRLFLMEAVRALEDAGLTRAALDGTPLGIFVGCKAGDYFRNLGAEDRNAQAFTGNATAILPARLAYHLNTTGPTLTVDTACSSALVALHLACESLRSGECETAVAGAVALMATPHTHLTLSRAGMLSPTGRCRAFDNGGDGFVPGEGVGAVVLKRLDRALADGDRIDGVIRASAINQDGRTSSLTAPSAPSQTRLLSELYAKAGIDPASISYIEAHGTGTKLGDPIEAAALTDAFAGKLPPGWRGSIGSVKSMIGHAMEAAGMAALVKTLLMLRAGRLAPSLHFDAPNEHIDFAALPFEVVREARDWAAPAGGGPRRAAISAFGFSGTNAHVVVEERPAGFALPSHQRPALAFFVSGHSEAALRRRCGDLADWLARSTDVDLAALSATLLLGREHYGYRAAVCGGAREEIVNGLRAASEGRAGAQVLLGGGAVKQEPALLELGKLLIERIQAPGLGAADYREKLMALGDLYTKGYALNFETLFAGARPAFVSLPPYPFDERRCWVEPADAGSDLPAVGMGLLGRVDEAGSLGTGMVFRSEIPARHWVFADHRVRGRSILPASALIGMALEAGRRLYGDGPIGIEGLRFVKPLEGEGGASLVTELREDGALTVASDAGPHLICRLTKVGHDEGPRAERVGLAGATRRIDGAAFYERCAEAGLVFGPHFRRLREVSGDGTVAVGRIEGAVRGFDAGWLDAVLQTVGGREPGTSLNAGRAVMPVAADRIECFSPLPAEAEARARLGTDGRFAIDVTDADGGLVLRIGGLAFVELAAPTQVAADAHALDIYLPRWTIEAVPAETAPEKVAILGGAGAPELVRSLTRLHAGARSLALDGDPGDADLIYWLGALDTAAEDGLPSVAQVALAEERVLVPLLRCLKSQAGRCGQLKVVTDRGHFFAPGDVVRPIGAAALGLAKAAAREVAPLRVSAIDIDLRDDPDGIVRGLAGEPGHGDGEDIALRRGLRWRRILERAELERGALPLRERGCCVILGGAGGLGRVLSRHLAERRQARLVWIGRRAEDDAIRAALAEVRAAGGEAIYLSADGGDPEALRAALAEARGRFGEIHGVVHSALVLRDSLIAGMDEADLLEALAPKTRGIAALVEALGDAPLDFLCLFSSAISFSGNAGQANYAAASQFIDAYAAGLRAATAYRVVTIDWGYWGETGIVADDATRRRMSAQGVLSIEAGAGMEAFERLLANGVGQAMPICLAGEKRAAMADSASLLRRAEEALSARLPRASGPAEKEAATTGEAYDSLDRYARRRLAEVLRFALPESGARDSLGEIRARLALSQRHEALFEALIEMLIREGIARLDGETLEVAEYLPAERPEAVAVRDHLLLLEQCLDGLGDLLSDRSEATQLLFPGGDRDKVQAVYRGNPTMAACDAMLGELAAGFLTAHAGKDAARRFRILEIGGGTGAATRHVLAALSGLAGRIEYDFTDVSRSFASQAEAAFGGAYPFVRFGVLDVASPPGGQGFDIGSYDLVIASNVLHAVGDLSAALGHAKSLLKQGGLLLVNEVTARFDAVTLTFGLTPEWWSHGGSDGRLPHAPLLS